MSGGDRTAQTTYPLVLAGVLLSASASAPRATPDTDLSAPALPAFQLAISEGRLKPGTPETKHILGKMFIDSFFSGVAAPGFDAAVSQVDAVAGWLICLRFA
jgi:hypothetical protein